MAPLPIGFAVFMVHLATIPITGTGINPARSFGAAVIINRDKVWDDQVRLLINYLALIIILNNFKFFGSLKFVSLVTIIIFGFFFFCV